MIKLAFVFPGQGAQFIGMSKTLCEQNTLAKRTFEEASEILGFDLAGLCFEGSALELNKPAKLFPSILVSSVASFRVYMQDFGISPQLCAGHSLGEISALTCAGAIKFTDAVKIVHKRGLLAQDAVETTNGTMTIIDDIDKSIVEEECRNISTASHPVAVSCYNSQTQTAISGDIEAMQKVEDRVIELGGHISPLIDCAPFHCLLMQSGAEKFKIELEKYSFSNLRYPVISNVTARIYKNVDSIVDTLTRQLISPVRWESTISYMQKMGITHAIEMGPKNVLTNLVKANSKSINSICIAQKESRNVLEELILLDGQVKKHIPTVITKCLSAAVSTPNTNWDDNEFNKGVIKPLKRIQEIQETLEKECTNASIEQMKEAFELLKTIFVTKNVPFKEQEEWFNQILDETGTNYII